MNEELIARALRMLEDRADHYNYLASHDAYKSSENIARACAYESAVNILYYAIEDKADCLAQFDTYREEEEG